MAQLRTYVSQQRDVRNGWGVTYDVGNPYRIGGRSPNDLGFSGIDFDGSSSKVGRWGSYTFNYTGGGIIVYSLSRPSPQERYVPRTQPAPVPLPLPLPIPVPL